LLRYPDLVQAGMDLKAAEWHFFRFGKQEGRRCDCSGLAVAKPLTPVQEPVTSITELIPVPVANTANHH